MTSFEKFRGNKLLRIWLKTAKLRKSLPAKVSSFKVTLREEILADLADSLKINFPPKLTFFAIRQIKFPPKLSFFVIRQIKFPPKNYYFSPSKLYSSIIIQSTSAISNIALFRTKVSKTRKDKECER